MKGKGKGKEKSSSDEPIDLKDLPITLPEFANGNDHAKYFPRFSSVLKRSDQDGVGKLLIEINFYDFYLMAGNIFKYFILF